MWVTKPLLVHYSVTCGRHYQSISMLFFSHCTHLTFSSESSGQTLLGLTVRTAMLGPDPLRPLQVAYWKLPTQPQRLTKGQLTFISKWVPRTVEQKSDLTTYLL
jgi:hypothetical protein